MLCMCASIGRLLILSVEFGLKEKTFHYNRTFTRTPLVDEREPAWDDLVPRKNICSRNKYMTDPRNRRPRLRSLSCRKPQH